MPDDLHWILERFDHLDEALESLTASSTIQRQRTSTILALERDILYRLCKLTDPGKENHT